MHQQINLYQSGIRKEAILFSGTSIWQGCAAAVLMLLGMYGLALHHLTDLGTELDNIALQESKTLDRIEQLAPIIEAINGERNWTAILEEALATLEERQAVVALLQGSELGDVEGFSRYLKSLARQETSGLWLTHITLSAGGGRMNLKGRAVAPELVPRYLQRLAEEPPFQGQRFSQFQIDRPKEADTNALQFSIVSEASRADEFPVAYQEGS